MGTEWDFRIRQKLNEFVNISASYARFWPGSFTSSFAPPTGQQIPPVNLPGGTITGQTGTTDGLSAKPSNFFYLEATLNAFGDGKPIAKLPGSDFVATWDKNPKDEKKPTWNDVYVGLNGGGAWASPVMTVQNVPTAFQASVIPRSTAVAIATGNTLPSKYINSLKGFIGGVQLGANWNIYGNILGGFEADLDGTAGNTNNQTNLGANRSSNGTLYTSYNQHSTTLNYLGTGRGRLGYLITPTVLVYGTGGLAYGGVTAINSYTYVAGNSPLAATSFGATYVGTLTGWSAGGGLEWMFTPEWSVKGDYLYYDLGSVSFKDNFTSRPWAYAPPSSYDYSSAVMNASWSTASFTGNVIHAGINRHFDVKGIVSLTEKD
jgi:opacity protein-like surface antigen